MAPGEVGSLLTMYKSNGEMPAPSRADHISSRAASGGNLPSAVQTRPPRYR